MAKEEGEIPEKFRDLEYESFMRKIKQNTASVEALKAST